MSTVTTRGSRARVQPQTRGTSEAGGPGGQGDPGGPGGPGNPGDPVAFALSSSHINNQGLLDYQTKTGLASYQTAVAPLSKELYN